MKVKLLRRTRAHAVARTLPDSFSKLPCAAAALFLRAVSPISLACPSVTKRSACDLQMAKQFAELSPSFHRMEIIWYKEGGIRQNTG